MILSTLPERRAEQNPNGPCIEDDAGAKVLIVDKPVDFEVSATVLAADDLTSHAPLAGEPAQVADDVLALLIYTSGTTGRPKGVMLDHSTLAVMCQMTIDNLELTAADHCAVGRDPAVEIDRRRPHAWRGADPVGADPGRGHEAMA